MVTVIAVLVYAGVLVFAIRFMQYVKSSDTRAAKTFEDYCNGQKSRGRHGRSTLKSPDAAVARYARTRKKEQRT